MTPELADAIQQLWTDPSALTSLAKKFPDVAAHKLLAQAASFSGKLSIAQAYHIIDKARFGQ